MNNVNILKESLLDYVSVVIPVYNEEKYISKCIDSLLQQNYPHNSLEFIFVDGNSKDSTVKIIELYQNRYPNLIKVLSNPNRTAPYAMNIGIHAAVGKYIIRMDAHSEYSIDYIMQCVEHLKITGANNVGGIAETISNGYVGKTIALMLASKFGVGNSQFRINGEDGYVDTVPFGAFPKDIFEKYGYYDERLTRNQDNEMNSRIRRNGGKIFLTSKIKFKYYCRDSVDTVLKMAVQNGKWNILTCYLCPGSMSKRHFVPFLFVMSLIFMVIYFSLPQRYYNVILNATLISELLLYIVLNICFSTIISFKSDIKHLPLLLILFPSFHIFYGIGSILGLVNLIKMKGLDE